MRSSAFPLLITLVIGVLCWDRFHDPAFWDEPKVYFRPLFALYEDFFGYLNSTPTPFDRPLGLPLLYLPFVHLFDPDIFVIRCLNFVILITGLWLFYFSIPARGRWSACLSLILLLVTPITQVYFIDYLGEYQVFCCFAAILYLLEHHPHRIWPAFLIAFISGTIRESGLALIPAVLCYNFVEKKIPWRQSVILASAPLWGVSLHWARNFLLTGEMMYHVTMLQGSLSLTSAWSVRWHQFVHTLLASYRLWPLLLASAVGVSWRVRHKKRVMGVDAFAWTLMASFVLVFTAHEHGIPRYYLAVIPFMFFGLLRPAEELLQNRTQQIVAAVIILAAVMTLGDPTEQGKGRFFTSYAGLQDGYQRRHIQEQHRNVIAAVQRQVDSGDVIVTSWPFVEMLRSSRMGYGQMKDWRVLMEEPPHPPHAILWTDLPEQMPWRLVEHWTQSAQYHREDFSYGQHRVILFVKVK